MSQKQEASEIDAYLDADNNVPRNEEPTLVIRKTINELGDLLEEKNKSYGNSFQHSVEIIKILYGKQIREEQYGDCLAMIRVIDKLFRIANKKDAFGENPWKDIAGYAILKSSESKNPSATTEPLDGPIYWNKYSAFIKPKGDE